MSYYNSKEAPSSTTKTFTARITIPDKAPARYANCKIWNGVLVRLEKIGRGKKTEKGGMNAFGEGETWEVWNYYAYEPVPLFCKAKHHSEEDKADRPGGQNGLGRYSEGRSEEGIVYRQALLASESGSTPLLTA